MSVFELKTANTPLIISVPHDGTLIPQSIKADMNPEITDTPDRDHHIGKIFEFETFEYNKITALHSRYVVDLNRPIDGEKLYSGQRETTVCPVDSFAEQALYQLGKQPGQAEIKRRIDRYWQPYHQQLQQLIDQATQQFGYCLLIDAHSIAAQVPRFFNGKLPDINVGTFSNQSCDPRLQQQLKQQLEQQNRYSHVFNGRFKGGHITRHYGQPQRHVHAIQLEHSKAIYLNSTNQLSQQAPKLQQFWQQTIPKLLQTTRQIHN